MKRENKMDDDKKKDAERKPVFSFDLDDKSKEEPVDEHDKIAKRIDDIIEHRKGSSSSAEEQARRYEEVLNNPPEPGYDELEYFEAVDDDGNMHTALVDPDDGDTIAKTKDGEEDKVHLLEPLLVLDLYTLFSGQLAEASMDVVPMLMDEKVQIEMNERKEYKPEKPKKDLSNWYWVLYVIIFVPMIIVGLAWLTGIW